MAGMSESAIQRYEEKAKQGLLFGDSNLRNLYERMGLDGVHNLVGVGGALEGDALALGGLFAGLNLLRVVFRATTTRKPSCPIS